MAKGILALAVGWQELVIFDHAIAPMGDAGNEKGGDVSIPPLVSC
jgi:hypothetical protein